MHPLITRLTSSKLVKNSLVYVIADGLNKSIPFLLLPLITHYLTPADYGVVSNYNIFVQILSLICFYTTGGALPVMYFKLEPNQRKSFVSNMLLLNSFICLLCFVCIMPISGVLFDKLYIPTGFQIVALVSVWFASITNTNLVLWRCEEKPIMFGAYQISQTAANAISTIYFVMVLLLGWQGRVYSMVFATVLFGAFSLVVLYKRGYICFEYNKEFINKIILFALPLLPHALSFWFKSGVNNLLLTNLCGLDSTGLYAVALTWGAIVTMFMMAFNSAYAPFLYQKLSLIEKDQAATVGEQRRIVKLTWGSLPLIFIFSLAAYFVSYLLIQWIYAPSYHDAVDYLPYLMLGECFNGCYLMFICFIHYRFKTKVLGAMTFSLSLFQILISYLLIKSIGPIGAAIASAIGAGLIFIFVASYAIKVTRLPWFTFNKA